jgi:alanine racemase
VVTGPLRATRALVRLAAIRSNVQVVRRALAPPTRLWAVVKANAYGHGAVPVAMAALEAGADALAVALPEEGWELRRAGVGSRILVLGPILPEQAVSVVSADLDAIVFSPAVIAALARAGSNAGGPVRVHLKVDTGMGRVGARPEDVAALAERIAAEPALRWAGLMTHLADADHDEREWTRGQYQQLLAVVEALRRRGWSPPIRPGRFGSPACRPTACGWGWRFMAWRPGQGPRRSSPRSACNPW